MENFNQVQNEEINRLKKLTEYLYKTQKHKEFVLNKMLETNRIMKKENSKNLQIAVSKARIIDRKKKLKKIKINTTPRNKSPINSNLRSKLDSINNFLKSNIKLNPIQERAEKPRKSVKNPYVVSSKRESLKRQISFTSSNRRRNTKFNTLKFGRMNSLNNGLKTLDPLKKYTKQIKTVAYELEEEIRNNGNIPTAEDLSFSAIFFENIFKFFNYQGTIFANDKIDENLQKNEKYHFLRNLSASEDSFVDKVKEMDYVAMLHTRDIITQFFVKN